MNDSLQFAANVAAQTQSCGGSINWWMVISIIEFAVIVILLLGRTTKHYDKRSRVKQQVKSEGDIDFGNIVNSAFGAEALYKELIRKCHPDRFAPDAEKMAIANDITERLGKNKNDIKKLNELKVEAIDKLNINL